MKWIMPKNSDEFSPLFLKRAALSSSLKLNPKKIKASHLARSSRLHTLPLNLYQWCRVCLPTASANLRQKWPSICCPKPTKRRRWRVGWLGRPTIRVMARWRRWFKATWTRGSTTTGSPSPPPPFRLHHRRPRRFR